MSAPKLDAGQIDQLIVWRESGWTYRQIGAQLRVSDGAVHYQCLKHCALAPRQLAGPRRAFRPSVIAMRNGRILRHFTRAEDQQLLALEAAGKTVRQIAEALGRARTSVKVRLMTLAQHDELAEAS